LLWFSYVLHSDYMAEYDYLFYDGGGRD
jgi:hypothetical protein